MAEARIQVLSGPEAGKEVTFRDSLILGRSHAAGLVLHHPTVSREHARIFFRNGTWNVVDLKSRNGTRLRGKPVTREEIRHGDELVLGEVRLRFFAAPGGSGEKGPAPVEEREREGEGAPPPEEGGGIPGPGEELSLGGEEITLEESPGEEPPLSRKVAPSPPPVPPSGRKGPASRPGPLPARPAAPRLGEGREDLLGPRRRDQGGGGLLQEDLSQWSGFAKFLAFLAGLALAAVLFYLAYRVAS